MSNAEQRTTVQDVRNRRLINPKAPQPPGQIISPERLTPLERELLTNAGVDCTKPIPDDLSERVQLDIADLPAKLAIADLPAQLRGEMQGLADQLPPGFSLPSQDLQLRGEEETLSADELGKAVERYRTVVQDLQQVSTNPAVQPPSRPVAPPTTATRATQPTTIQQAIEAARQHGVANIRQANEFAGISPNIAEALRGMPEDEPASRQASPATAAGAQAPADTRSASSEEEVAAKREAARQELLEKIRRMVPPVEVERYREAVITFAEYSRSFMLADGAIEIVFRDYGGEENDMLVLQEAIDRRKGRTPQQDLAAQLHNSNKYMLALCLVSIKSKKQATPLLSVPAEYPLLSYLDSLDLNKLPGYSSDPDDTPLHAWASYLMRYVLRGSVYSLMMQAFSTFLSDLEGMKRLARERDFF